MNDQKLWQFQCMREGTMFYYQHQWNPSHMIERCPLCSCKRIRFTGRVFDGLDENYKLDANRKNGAA